MTSLSIAFDRICWSSDRRPAVYSSDVFAALFLLPTNPLSLLHRLRCLSIRNLQSRPELQVTTSPRFLELVRKISILELDITTPKHDFRPARRIVFIETREFYLHLPQVWLAPASANLRALRLFADVTWGWYPKVDLRGTYFPQLEDLTLERFTFSHDWQLQWLSDHASSLKRLSFTACVILEHASSSTLSFDSEGYPISVGPWDIGPKVPGSFSHMKRWSAYFKAIENTLPELQSFSLVGPKYVFGTDLYFPYLVNSSKGYSLLVGGWAQQDDDKQALRELLATIRQRNSTNAQEFPSHRTL